MSGPADDTARQALLRLIEERGEDYAGLSRLIGRNAAYIHQFIKRGSPRRLAEEDRRRLAAYFGVDESVLGGRPTPPAPQLVTVPKMEVVASAGPGALPGEEQANGHIGFDPAWLRRVAGTGDPRRLHLLKVEGDSMLPTLSNGDDILVDTGDTEERLRDGIYVLRMGDGLLVKRVAVDPAGRSVAVISDNAHHPSWPECDAAALSVVGRVLWAGRVLG